MEKIRVNTSQKYDVILDRIDNIGGIISRIHEPCKVMIVSDENVAPLYLNRVVSSLKKSGFNSFAHILPAGEMSKCMERYVDIISDMQERKFLRSDIVISLGGGVIGDIGGFVASTYMRGVDFVNIPTSLIGMIDSAVGGKCGIDFGGVKNLIGSFYQPKVVIIDTLVLDTLQDIEWKNGLGEGIKYALLAGGKIADIIEVGVDGNNVYDFVKDCIEYKANIVVRDEKDYNERHLLNLGHTIGHALEAKSGYVLRHGIAVAKGIRAMLDASFKAGEIAKRDYNRALKILSTCAYYDSEDIDIMSLARYITLDKKGDGASIAIVKIKGIGKCEIAKMSGEQFVDYLTK